MANTEVEIMGHKAKIDRVFGQAKDDLRWKADQLVVWIDFYESVGGTSAFPIYLPAKKYADRDEFLYNVRRRGEETLKRILERDEQETRQRQEKDESQKAVDALAAEAQKLIE